MIFKADCILVGDDFDELTPGLVRVEDGKIVALGSDVSTADDETIDFTATDKKAVIMPGLIDCHCHLELSLLEGAVPFGGSLVGWLGKLIVKSPKRRATQSKAVRHGVRMSLAAGTTTIADISANGRSWEAMLDMPVRKICFAEVIGIGSKTETAMHNVENAPDGMGKSTPMFMNGISPHAPYSTDTKVFSRAIELAAESDLRLTTHLAEDTAELEFVETGGGPWRDVLETFGIWDETINAHGGTPVAWADDIGLLDTRAILAHVNYVTDDDIELLAAGRASVAYCPLAHRFFRHAPHRYREMIDAGVALALGNDSVACAGKLSVLEQMRAVYQAGGLSARDVIAMGTRSAASALGLADMIGTIQTGKTADMVVVLVDENSAAMTEAVLSQNVTIACTLVDGHVAYDLQRA